MKLTIWRKRTGERRATVLAGLILLQALCALFFIADVIKDFRDFRRLDNPSLIVESVVAVALVGGVIFLMLELRRLLSRMSDMQTGLDVARGLLAKVIEDFFDEWKLSAAERDVAIMILKGLDNDTIAQMRNTRSGTVRAQATSVYAKSATEGRAHFISLFMEELMAGDIGPDDAPMAHATGQKDDTSTAGQAPFQKKETI